MTTFVAWIVLAYGLTLIVTGSKLFEPLRRRADTFHELFGFLIHCPMCFGFWVGVFLSLRYHLGPSFFALSDASFGRPERALLDGAGASGVCWSVHVVLAKLGAEEL